MRKALYILGQLDDSDVEWLADCGTRRSLVDGEIIVHEGRPLDALFITLAGQLRVTVGPGSKEVSRLNAGELVGEISVVDSGSPSATVAALGPALVLALPKTVLQTRLDADAYFASRFYRALAILLADRLRSTTKRLGYGKSGDLESETQLDNEIDVGVLDTLSDAGQRFGALLRRLSVD
jgi:CRP/FNR family cyclic AMP-dependent transcriptional regulator